MRKKLEKLTAKEIESITQKTKRKRDVPLIVSKASQVILDDELNNKIEVLSVAQGMTAEKFIANLLKEDIDRLWKVYKREV